MITNLIATSVPSFGDKFIAIAIIVVVAVFLFWFLWPSPEDDNGPFSDGGDFEEGEEEEDFFVDHRKVFDRIFPNLRCDMSPILEATRNDNEAFIIIKAKESLRDVAHFVQTILESVGYESSHVMNHASQSVMYEVVSPVGFELTLTESNEGKGLFILAFEY